MILSYFRGDAIQEIEDDSEVLVVADNNRVDEGASDGVNESHTMIRRRSRRGKLPLPDGDADEDGE